MNISYEERVEIDEEGRIRGVIKLDDVEFDVVGDAREASIEFVSRELDGLSLRIDGRCLVWSRLNTNIDEWFCGLSDEMRLLDRFNVSDMRNKELRDKHAHETSMLVDNAQLLYEKAEKYMRVSVERASEFERSRGHDRKRNIKITPVIEI